MNVWNKEITTIVILLIGALIIGVISHLFFPVLFLVISGILVRQIIQINRFEKWIRTGGSGKYPKTSGIWEAIYYHVYRLKKSEKKRKKKLGKMVDQFRKSTEARRNNRRLPVGVSRPPFYNPNFSVPERYFANENR